MILFNLVFGADFGQFNMLSQGFSGVRMIKIPTPKSHTHTLILLAKWQAPMNDLDQSSPSHWPQYKADLQYSQHKAIPAAVG